MDTFVNILLWLHFIGVGLAMGGGIALSQIGPRLVAAPADQRVTWWPLETFFGRLGAAGLLILLISGPMMVWLKFGGPGGFTHWFWIKMTFVAIATGCVGLHEWAGARFKRGEETAIPLMFTSGRMAGGAIVLAMLFAVLTFN